MDWYIFLFIQIFIPYLLIFYNTVQQVFSLSHLYNHINTLQLTYSLILLLTHLNNNQNTHSLTHLNKKIIDYRLLAPNTQTLIVWKPSLEL